MPARVRQHRALLGGLVVLLNTCPALAGGPPPVHDGFYSHSYRTEPPTGVIAALEQDADGFLWLGTDIGLIRFDGLEFQVWGGNGKPSLPDNYVVALLSTRDKALWIGFRNGAVTRMSEGALRNFSRSDGLPGGYITTFFEDSEGALWAGGEAGLARYSHNSWQILTSSEGLPDRSRVFRVRQDQQRTLWVATDAGLYRRAPRQTKFELAESGTIRDVYEDARGEIWITGDHRGLLKLGTSEDLLRRLALGRSVRRRLFRDSHGDLWIGATAGGLWRARILTKGVQLERVSATDNVYSIIEDREGGIWVATPGSLKHFFHHDVKMVLFDSGGTNIVRAVDASPDGSIWVAGTATVTRLADASGREESLRVYQLPAGARALRALHFYQAHTVMLGAEDGLWRLTDSKFTRLTAQSASPFGSVWVIEAGDRGAIWVCHSGEGWLSRWKDGEVTDFKNDPAIRGKTCTAVNVDRRGRVWIGFADGSIAIYENGVFRLYSRDNGLSGGMIYSFYEDDADTTWIGTSLGLSRLQNHTFTTLGAIAGLSGFHVEGLVEDRRGYLWLAVGSGIVRLDKIEFDAAVSDPSHRVEYRLFDSSDGLLAPTSWFGSRSAVRASDGKLWFVTLNGVAVVDPEALSPEKHTVSVRIDRAVIDGHPLLPSSAETVLPRDSSIVQIDYTAVNVAAPSKIRFRYRLEGFDKEWVSASSRRQAAYTNLSPGDYRFVVAATLDGRNDFVRSWKFVVQPRFYQTRLFYLGCAMLIAVVFSGAWRFRSRILKRRFELVLNERARIGRELHDTVLQGLSGAALQLESLAARSEASPVASGDLRRLRRQLEDCLYEARQSIIELRSELLGPKTLPASLRKSAEDIVAGITPTPKLEVNVSGTPLRHSRSVEIELVRIAQEAVRNIIRHGDAQNVRVGLQYLPGSLSLTVSDDGRGFNSDEEIEETRPRWGIIGMRERAKRIGGAFRLVSKPGGGTEIAVVVSFREGRNT